MNKYGIEHFKVETIEETNSPEEREQFWIKEYNSYGSTGYNATKGGDGSKRADYDLICSLWKQGLSCRDISQKLGYDGATIRAALQDNGISAEERHKRGALKISKQVSMLDLKTNKVLKTFPSITDSLTYLNKAQMGLVIFHKFAGENGKALMVINGNMSHNVYIAGCSSSR